MVLDLIGTWLGLGLGLGGFGTKGLGTGLDKIMLSQIPNDGAGVITLNPEEMCFSKLLKNFLSPFQRSASQVSKVLKN